eukprot:6182148-Pleurochrysis_carterae.AAC.1
MKGCDLSDVWDMNPPRSRQSIGNAQPAPQAVLVSASETRESTNAQPRSSQTHIPVSTKQFEMFALHLSRQIEEIRSEQHKLHTKLWLTSVGGFLFVLFSLSSISSSSRKVPIYIESTRS